MSRIPRVSAATVSWQEVRMLWRFTTLTAIRRGGARIDFHPSEIHGETSHPCESVFPSRLLDQHITDAAAHRSTSGLPAAAAGSTD